MLSIVEQTDKEKMKMYLKLPKKKLAEMLIQCNKILDSCTLTVTSEVKLSDKCITTYTIDKIT